MTKRANEYLPSDRVIKYDEQTHVLEEESKRHLKEQKAQIGRGGSKRGRPIERNTGANEKEPNPEPPEGK